MPNNTDHEHTPPTEAELPVAELDGYDRWLAQGDDYMLGREGELRLVREVRRLWAERSADSEHRVAFRDIAAEREAQDKQWGGTGHDLTHSMGDWRAFREKQENRACAALRHLRFDEGRAHLVKLAALVVAEIEAIDAARQEPTP